MSVVSDTILEPLCTPAHDIPLLAFRTSRQFLVLPHVQTKFTGRSSRIGDSMKSEVWLGQQSAIELKEALRDILIAALTQSSIAKNHGDAVRMITEVMNNEGYRSDPNTYPRFKKYVTANMWSGFRWFICQNERYWLHMPKWIGKYPIYGIQAAADLCEYLSAGKCQSGRLQGFLDSSRRFCDKNTLEVKYDVYENVICPILLMYGKLDSIIGQKCGVHFKWTPNNDVAPIFEDMTSIVPENDLHRAMDCLRRMNAVRSDTTTNSYETFQHLIQMYQQFICIYKQLTIQESGRRALRTTDTTDMISAMTSIVQNRVHVNDPEWKSKLLNQQLLIATVLMKCAVYGCGADPSQKKLLMGMDTFPNCYSSDAEAQYRIYERGNVANINEKICRDVRERLYMDCGRDVVESLDFSPEGFVTSLMSYIDEQECQYHECENSFTQLCMNTLRSLANEVKDPVEEEATEDSVPSTNQNGNAYIMSHNIITMLEYFVENPGDALSGLEAARSLIQTGSRIICENYDRFKEPWDLYKRFMSFREKYDKLKQIRSLLQWYELSTEALKNPDTIAIRLELTDGQMKIGRVVIDCCRSQSDNCSGTAANSNTETSKPDEKRSICQVQ